MNIVWILSSLYIALFNIEFVSTAAHQRILHYLPLLPETEASKNGTIVKDVDECQSQCSDSQNFLFGRGEDGALRCLCSNETNPFRYDLVAYPEAVFESQVHNTRGLDYFIYMRIQPVASSEIKSMQMNDTSLDTCALVCLNAPAANCQAFSYDPTSKACRLFSKPYDENSVEYMSPVSNMMYFTFLGSFLTRFSRQWGLVTAPYVYQSNTAQGSSLLSHSRKTYNTDNLRTCAENCYYDWNCKHIYFNILKNTCNSTLPSRKNGTNVLEPDYIYVEQVADDCPASTVPTSFDTGMFRSPGFPYSYDTKPCSWQFLTPWGKALAVTLNSAQPTGGVCSETIQINGVSREICQAGNQTVGLSDTGLNTVQLKASKSNSDGIAFVAEYETEWACQSGKPLKLQGPGEMASNGYPSAFLPSACSWQISDGSTNPVNVIFDSFDFTSEPMMMSANLSFSDSRGKTVSCTNSNSCLGKTFTFTSPVAVEFQSGMYFKNPKGFKLSYNFNPTYFKPAMEAITDLTISKKGDVTKQTKSNLQEYAQVNVMYTISNTITDGNFSRIALSLNSIILGENDGDKNCLNGNLTVTDPELGISYVFCDHEVRTTRIISKGKSLNLNIVIPPQTHLPSTMPHKMYNFSATHFDGKKVNDEIIVNPDTGNFTSQNYPENYPPNEIQTWRIQNVDGKLAVLIFSDVKLAQYQILTRTVCDNDRLFLMNGDKKTVFDCRIRQNELPIHFVQHGKLTVTMSSNGIHESQGFLANVEYYDAVACVGSDTDPVVVNIRDSIIVSEYDKSRVGPCRWRLEMDFYVECLEGCSMANYTETSKNATSKVDYLSRELYKKGTIIEWNGNERSTWFSALMIGLPTTPGPTSDTTTLEVTTEIDISSEQPTTIEVKTETPSQRPTTIEVKTETPSQQPTTNEVKTETTTQQPATTEASTQPDTPTAPSTTAEITRPSKTTDELTTKGKITERSTRQPVSVGSTTSVGGITTTSNVPSVTTTNSTGAVVPSSTQGLTAGEIAGIALGSFFLLLLIIIAILLLLNRGGYDINILHSVSNPFANLNVHKSFSSMRTSLSNMRNPFSKGSRPNTNENSNDPYGRQSFSSSTHGLLNEDLPTNGSAVHNNPCFDMDPTDYVLRDPHLRIDGLDDVGLNEA